MQYTKENFQKFIEEFSKLHGIHWLDTKTHHFLKEKYPEIYNNSGEEQKLEKQKIQEFDIFCNGLGIGEYNEYMPTWKQMGIVGVEYIINTNTLKIWSTQPGIVIGKGGGTINYIKEKMECEVEVIEHKIY